MTVPDPWIMNNQEVTVVLKNIISLSFTCLYIYTLLQQMLRQHNVFCRVNVYVSLDVSCYHIFSLHDKVFILFNLNYVCTYSAYNFWGVLLKGVKCCTPV